MIAFIQEYLIFFKIIAAGLLAAALFGAGWTVNGWRLNTAISDLKAAHADEKTIQATGALKELTDATHTINAAAADASVNIAGLSSKLDDIQREFKNAKPLPIDCRPDDFRLRELSAAVDAVKQALAGSKPSPAVQDPVAPGNQGL